MKIAFVSRTAALVAALAAVCWPAGAAAQESLTDAIEVVRGIYQSDRQALLAEAMQFTEKEGVAFWPLYRQYRAEREKLGDGPVKLVLEYADFYPDVPEDRARQLLKDYTALQKKLADQRTRYLGKFGKILSPAKTLRFAQLEERMDLVLRLQLASAIPLVPATPRR
jgi:hypothetical protein